jgi:hypothetical protein
LEEIKEGAVLVVVDQIFKKEEEVFQLRCIKPPVVIVANLAKSHLNLVVASLCIAEIVLLKKEVVLGTGFQEEILMIEVETEVEKNHVLNLTEPKWILERVIVRF